MPSSATLDTHQKLQSKSVHDRLDGLAVILNLEPADIAIQANAIVMLTKDTYSEVRLMAVTALSRLDGHDLRPHLCVVAQLLDDPEPGVRRLAIQLVGNTSMSKEHAAAVAQQLSNKNWEVRRAAVEALNNQGPGTLEQYADQCLNHIDDNDTDARLAAVDVLGQLSQEVLTEHIGTLCRRVQDERPAVRRAAISAFSRLDPEILGEHADVIVQRLEDWDDRVRRLATDLIGKMQPIVFLMQAEAIVHKLEHRDREVRFAAINVLCRLDAAVLNKQAPSIARSAAHHDWEVRLAAVNLLGRLDPTILVCYASAIARRLEDQKPAVRRAAVDVLGRLDPKALEQHTQAIANQLASQDETVRDTVLQLLCRMAESSSPSTIDSLIKILSLTDRDATTPHGETLLHQACRRGNVALVGCLLGRFHAENLHAQDNDGNTPLHLAAQEGHLGVCKALVRTGALFNFENSDEATPAALAWKSDHVHVYHFLEGLNRNMAIRGGSGDAVEAAMLDWRPVTKVDWYTFALPGVIGGIGAKHSLLAITVSSPEAHSHIYVMEKASLALEDGEVEPEEFMNGVFISHWEDIALYVPDLPIHTLDSSQIASTRIPGGITMSKLREVSVDLGPYNLVNCNCHHAAMEIYNICAKEEFRVTIMPNHLLMTGVRLLTMGGVDVAAVLAAPFSSNFITRWAFEFWASDEDENKAASLDAPPAPSSADKLGQLFSDSAQDWKLMKGSEEQSKGNSSLHPLVVTSI